MFPTRLFLLAAMAVALMGCCETPKPPPSITFVPVPSSLLLPCSSVKPPNKEQYKAATPDEKEKMLMDTINKQNGTLSKCNIQIMGTADWSTKQKANFQKKEGVP